MVDREGLVLHAQRQDQVVLHAGVVQGQSLSLYKKSGQRHVPDITASAGLEDSSAKALGIALLDHNNDGWLDLFVANDTQPNRLYEETASGKFVDIGVSAGVAFNEAGVRGAAWVSTRPTMTGSGGAEPRHRQTSRTR
jgi:hypothetical protein